MTIVTTIIGVIETFKHRGLKWLYTMGDTRGVSPSHVNKVRRILANLDAAETIEHMRLPAYRLHKLQGDLEGRYAVKVSRNWRIVFRFEDGKAFDIDLVDCH